MSRRLCYVIKHFQRKPEQEAAIQTHNSRTTECIKWVGNGLIYYIHKYILGLTLMSNNTSDHSGDVVDVVFKISSIRKKNFENINNILML